ncbi:MAG TPA: peptide chain release factor N(5)-glutamine methyltransferase [Gammaproteobacteria bacterium]|nr:peptide chain release factor N(5)-glutamine methyltransferase [Gammaproteobacteria bacterium]
MSITIQQWLYQAKQLLATTSDRLIILDLEILLAYALQQSRAYLHAWPEYELSDQEVNLANDYLRRRQHHEPMAYIIGEREFWSLELLVSRDTFIPRPETELLVETVLKIGEKLNDPLKIADLGTGCGAIALALACERSLWQIYATDISEHALDIAKQNAQRLGVKNLAFIHGNWCTALPYRDFDVIVSNPPYIAESEWERYADQLLFEPRQALVSGETGLDAIREISSSAKHFLKPTGFLVVEHGFSQGGAVRDLFAKMGYTGIVTIRDLSGNERMTVGQV